MSSMRITGLASGMDTESMVEKIMLAQRAPVDKLEQKKQTYEWQRDAYREVNKKLNTFDTYLADNFILKNLSAKSATSSNASLVSVKATSAATGSLSLDSVTQLATNARGVGDKQVSAVGSTKLSTLGIGSGSISLKAMQADGTMATKTTEIKIDSSMTVNDFVKKINSSDAGVTALFENGRLSITAKYSGDNKAGAEVQVTSGADVFGKLGFTSLVGKSSGDLASGGKNAIFEINGIATERSTNNFTINGFDLTLNKTFNEDKAHNNKVQEATANRDKALSTLKAALANLEGTYNLPASGNDFNTGITNLMLHLDADINAANSINLAQTKSNLDNKRAEVSGTSTLGDVYNNLSAENKLLLSDNFADLTDDQKSVFADEDQFDKLKALKSLQNQFDNETAITGVAQAAQAVKNNFQAQKQVYDNAQTALTNLAAEAVPTASESVPAVTMTATTNVDEIVDRLKDFVNTYNGLIKDLQAKKNEDVYRDYKPLTSPQRKDMQENEIKLWEEKAKSGMLRGDSILQSALTGLRELIYHKDPSIVSSKYNSLSNIGISTSSDWTLGGALEINESELRAALAEDPDAVVKLMTQEGEGSSEGYLRKIRKEIDKIEKSIDERAGRTTMQENQYTLGKSLQDVNQRLTDWQTKLKSIESRYWQQFSAMETMMNKANSQSTMLMNQFY